MAGQFRLFLCAVQFLTRLPVPALPDFQPEWITRGARYFPLVGEIVGGIMALVLLAASHVWSGAVPALLAVATGLLVTGAFHEDGLADTADGLGGGQTPARRMDIMKDSRIGTYGAVALGICLALKVSVLASLTPVSGAVILIAVNGGARAAAVCAMGVFRYAGIPEASKVSLAPFAVRGREIAAAIGLGLWPFLLLPPAQAVLGLSGGAILAAGVGIAAKRLIGGYTGDVLGAVEQLFEVGVLLGATASVGAR